MNSRLATPESFSTRNTPGKVCSASIRSRCARVTRVSSPSDCKRCWALAARLRIHIVGGSSFMSVRPKRVTRILQILIATNLATLGLIISQGAGLVGAQQSQSVLDQVVSRGSLRCGIPIGGLPVAAKDASGNIIGSVPDMCAEMAKGLGVRLEIVDTPTPDRIPFIQTGKIDVTIDTITLERAKAVGFSTPWVIDGTAAAFLNNSGISAYEDMHSKRLAVVTGATGDLVATSRFGDNDIGRVDLASTAIQAVLSGQADAVFDDFSTLSLAAA